MDLFTLILTGIGLAMDATAVSIAKGMTLSKNVLIRYAFLLALAFGFFQGFMPAIGYFAGSHFADMITNIDHWIAFILLSCIGLNMIKESFEENQNDNACTLQIPFKTIILLAIATSIDALAIGVSFAFLKVDILLASSIIGIITFTLSLLGVLVGKKLGSIFEKYAQRFGGGILILLGIKILIEHLFLS